MTTFAAPAPAPRLPRILAPFVAFQNAIAETKASMATHLLTFDDATLHSLGYRRADLKRGIVRPLTID